MRHCHPGLQELPVVRGDRIQLQQAIVTLMVNSIQAMKVTSPIQREIHLETGLNETGRIAFSIRDTGTGIPLDHMDQIFDGFFTTKEGGLA
ncbi:ATP-binding protein [Rhizobium sullae]|uniref:ATP-binding protein n=1 Tax=Rhizobium sullae TaxID=50338 RepID=A0A2N0DFT4_RHISU|nr:ATP-binding protein [Rhizobium sullae]